MNTEVPKHVRRLGTVGLVTRQSGWARGFPGCIADCEPVRYRNGLDGLDRHDAISCSSTGGRDATNAGDESRMAANPCGRGDSTLGGGSTVGIRRNTCRNCQPGRSTSGERRNSAHILRSCRALGVRSMPGRIGFPRSCPSNRVHPRTARSIAAQPQIVATNQAIRPDHGHRRASGRRARSPCWAISASVRGRAGGSNQPVRCHFRQAGTDPRHARRPHTTRVGSHSLVSAKFGTTG